HPDAAQTEDAPAEDEPSEDEPTEGVSGESALDDLPEPMPEVPAEEPDAEGSDAEGPDAEAPDADVVVLAPEPQAREEVRYDAGGSDPFRGDGDWYVVHTYAGYENKVKTNLESRIHTMQMEGKIFQVHIPMEDVME